MNFPEITRIYLNLPKFTWNNRNLSEFIWIYLNLLKITWIYLNLLEFTLITWIYLKLTELTWIYLDFPEFAWINLKLPEFTWIYLPHGSTTTKQGPWERKNHNHPRKYLHEQVPQERGNQRPQGRTAPLPGKTTLSSITVYHFPRLEQTVLRPFGVYCYPVTYLF